MALKAVLRSRAGADLTVLDLPDGTTTYPEVILGTEDVFILRRVMPDKRSAVYFEARTWKIKDTKPTKPKEDT